MYNAENKPEFPDSNESIGAFIGRSEQTAFYMYAAEQELFAKLEDAGVIRRVTSAGESAQVCLFSDNTLNFIPEDVFQRLPEIFSKEKYPAFAENTYANELLGALTKGIQDNHKFLLDAGAALDLEEHPEDLIREILHRVYNKQPQGINDARLVELPLTTLLIVNKDSFAKFEKDLYDTSSSGGFVHTFTYAPEEFGPLSLTVVPGTFDGTTWSIDAGSFDHEYQHVTDHYAYGALNKIRTEVLVKRGGLQPGISEEGKGRFEQKTELLAYFLTTDAIDSIEDILTDASFGYNFENVLTDSLLEKMAIKFRDLCKEHHIPIPIDWKSDSEKYKETIRGALVSLDDLGNFYKDSVEDPKLFAKYMLMQYPVEDWTAVTRAAMRYSIVNPNEQ